MSSQGFSPTGGVDSIGSVNRHKEAREMERQFAEFWANHEGRTLKRVTQQTCDGGKDFVGVENGTKVIGEVKHWGRPIDSYVVSDYVERANQEGADLAFGATNGLTGPAEEMAKEHGVEVLTGSDLPQPWYNQVIDILLEYAGTTADFVTRAANIVYEAVIKRVLMAVWGWWKRLSIREKVLVTVTVIVVAALIYYGRKHYQNDEESDSFIEWLKARLRIDEI